MKQSQLKLILFGCIVLGVGLLSFRFRLRNKEDQGQLKTSVELAATDEGQVSFLEETASTAVNLVTVPAPDATQTLVETVLVTKENNIFSEPTMVAPSFSLAPSDPAIQALAERTLGQKMPKQIRIPSVELDSPIIAVGWQRTDTQVVWDSPAFAAGFLVSSAPPGEIGNTVIYGHNNVEGEVFKSLELLSPGDQLEVELISGEIIEYVVSHTEIILEAGITASEQIRHLSYFDQTSDARLTLLTCWPYTSNSHRVVVIAYPSS